MKTRGFIGLGIMGFPMAGYISKKYPTLVFNRSVAKAENWVKTYKGEIGNSPAELGNVCEEIYMCIGNDDDVREVISCLLYTSPSPRDRTRSRMPSSA